MEDLLLVLLHLPACLLEHLFPLLAPHQEVLLLVLVAVLLPLQRLPLVLAVVHLLVLEGLLLLALVHGTFFYIAPILPLLVYIGREEISIVTPL